MDKVTEYPKLIEQILSDYIEVCNRKAERDVETFLIKDDVQQHYIWMNLGWKGSERITGMTVYVRLQDAKFWIEEDWTEEGIANDLLALGVPKEDIVLAFHAPKMRPYTDFAVA